MTGLSSFWSIISPTPIDPARASGAHDTLIRALGSGLSAFGEQIKGRARRFRRTDQCGAFGGLRYTHTSCPYRPFCRRPARVVARRRTNCICAILSQSIIRSTSVSISSNSACWAAISPRLDFIGLAAPNNTHRLPPSLMLRSAPCHNNAASPGPRYG